MGRSGDSTVNQDLSRLAGSEPEALDLQVLPGGSKYARAGTPTWLCPSMLGITRCGPEEARL
jgi:hypothetical protein